MSQKTRCYHCDKLVTASHNCLATATPTSTTPAPATASEAEIKRAHKMAVKALEECSEYDGAECNRRECVQSCVLIALVPKVSRYEEAFGVKEK